MESFQFGSILHKIAIGNFIMLAIAQFIVLPFLGYKIFNRCKYIGYEMKSRPLFTIFNISNLWREAREFNNNQNDEVIKQYLKSYKFFWIYAFVSFIFIVITSI